jgi:hypothetical protein
MITGVPRDHEVLSIGPTFEPGSGMGKKLVVAAAVAALATQGCTLAGFVIGANNASNANDDRDARIRAGMPPEHEEPSSVAAGGIGGGLIGFLIDGLLVLAVVEIDSRFGTWGSGDH